MWLPSDNGLVRYNYVSHKSNQYHLAHGLQSNSFKRKVSLKTSNGKIWLGGKNGINVFDPNEITKVQSPVNIYFNRLLVNDEIYPLDNHIDDQVETIDLKYYQNNIKLEFSAMDHSDNCLLYTSPSPRDATLSRMPSSA